MSLLSKIVQKQLTKELHTFCLQYMDQDTWDEIVFSYNESHRYWHNWDNHILTTYVELKFKELHTSPLYILTLLFHDIIYNPKKNNNADESRKLFLTFYNTNKIKNISATEMLHIEEMILGTENDNFNDLGHVQVFNDCDRVYLTWWDFKELLKVENLIQKEYQWVEWNTYKTERIKILNKLAPNNANVKQLIDYLNSYQPKIGVYCGSFNPFHVGHLDILRQAENVFDKVIIARGINDEKKNEQLDKFPSLLEFHQCDFYNGLLTEYLNSFDYPVTLIRGLRNGYDLLDESNLKAWLNLNNVVYFLSDKRYEHISSSSIRNLKNKYPDLVEGYEIK